MSLRSTPNPHTQILVYYPVCHWIWGKGFLHQMGVLDYAGGIVIHTTAGAGSLVCAAFVKPRKDFFSFHGSNRYPRSHEFPDPCQAPQRPFLPPRCKHTHQNMAFRINF